MPRRLSVPPSSISGPLGQWLGELHELLESQPNISIASLAATATPNSNVTGRSGDLCVNVGSASTDSRLWVLGGGTGAALTNTGWVLVRVAL